MIEQTDNMDNAVESVSALSSKYWQLKGEFAGVESSFAYLKCVLCNKKIGDFSPPLPKSVECQSYRKTVQLKLCPIIIVAKAQFYVAETQKCTLLTLFTDHLVDLLCKPAEDIPAMNSKELEKEIIEQDEMVVSVNNDNVVQSITYM